LITSSKLVADKAIYAESVSMLQCWKSGRLWNRSKTPTSGAWRIGVLAYWRGGLVCLKQNLPGMEWLCSKIYFCFGAEDKFSCKGVNRKTNDIHKFSKFTGKKENYLHNLKSLANQSIIYTIYSLYHRFK
jgi:hypothetical protein